MRYDAEHKAKTRERVLAEAGKEIRKRGPHEVSVGAVMKRAGLTHGGFYAHFASKDDMIAEAIGAMFDAGRARWVELTEDLAPAEAIGKYVDWYLSKAHRDSREAGCTLAALASDVPRLEGVAQRAYAEGAQRMIAWLASLLAALRRDEPDELARAVFAELVGTLLLSRIEPERRSDALLAAGRAAVRKRLKL